MELLVIGSSSKGNCYLLRNNKEALVIEAGINPIEVKKAVDFKISKIKGVLGSHKHLDHARYVRDFERMGITVYGPGEIFNPPSHRSRPVQPGKGFTAGGFKVVPFEVAHDVTCFGYLVEHEDMGRLVFMTDTYLSEFSFPGVNHWLVEANYSDEVLEEAVIEGRTHAAMKARLMHTHMALGTLIGMLEVNDLKQVRNIVLCHLSDNNSNADDFVRLVQETTGKPVYVADKGLTIDLSL